jgi:SARP family transcriptional regulator, regulator of embCAB operon
VVRLLLLDGFEVRDNGQSVALSPRAQRLLAFLAVAGRPVLRSRLAGILWPDKREERAAGDLRTLLWRVNGPGPALVSLNGSNVQLVPSASVDLHDMIALARRALAGNGDLDRAIDLDALSADLLPGWYEDWVLLERERLRQLRLHALEALCARFASAGRFGEAVEAGLRAVGDEPLRESAHTALIRAYLAEGNRGEATRQYRRFRDLLRTELGVEPSATLTELVRGFIRVVTPA